MKNKLSEVELHVAGAIVRHNNPFEKLVTLENEEPLVIDFIDKWVNPFYQNLFTNEAESLRKAFQEINNRLTPIIIKKLLGDFNWRTRIVGGYFSAIKEYQEFEDDIGKLLLKSELCYAGSGYCLALAAFETEKSIDYLKKYLNYYLDRKDLYFEQGDAMAALNWIDKKLNGNEMENFTEKWNDFISDKPHWNLEKSITIFNQQMNTIELIRQNLEKN